MGKELFSNLKLLVNKKIHRNLGIKNNIVQNLSSSESRHSSGMVNLPPPPTPIVKPTVKTPYCKVSKLKRTQSSGQIQSSSKINHTLTSSTVASSSTSIKRSAEQANLQSISSPRSPLESIPVQSSNSSVVPSSPVKSPGNSGQPRRKRLKADRGLLKDREYDPDRHCGVWNDETCKPCTRSLTCKAHTVSLRRTVIGRSKTFDKLLAEHRAAKEFPNRTSKVTLTGTVTVSTAVTSGLVNSFLAPNTPISASESDPAPGSPPVLSLPDTYPLPKVRFNFRGSTNFLPTKFSCVGKKNFSTKFSSVSRNDHPKKLFRLSRNFLPTTFARFGKFSSNKIRSHLKNFLQIWLFRDWSSN